MWGLPDPIEPNTLLSRRLLAPAGRGYSQLSIFLPRGCRTEAPPLLPPGPRPAPLSPAVERTVTAPKDVLALIPVNMLLYMVNGTLQMQLSQGSIMGEDNTYTLDKYGVK